MTAPPKSAVREFHVPANARAILVIVHGMAEYSARYRSHVDFFTARGIGVCTFDQRGHGRNVESEMLRGHIEAFDDFVLDAAALIEGVRAQYPGVPVFLWGHSMGAVVATLVAARLASSGPGKLRGVITSSPPFASFDAFPRWLLRVIVSLARIAPRYRMRRPFNPSRLSRDLEVGKRYAADPLVPRAVTLRFLTALYVASQAALKSARQLRMPWLVLHGSDDQIAPAIGSQRLFDALVSTDKQLRLWPGARHEVHNEIEPTRTEFLTLVAEWIEARI